MSYSYTTIDGQRVEVHVAAAYQRLRSAFKKACGLDLRISSGTRTRAEQTQIFLSRYVTAGNVRGRKVYDTRVWNGVRYYRVSPAGTVAQPGLSNHEESGPIGPRAIDIRDTGSNPGVTRRGTARDNWMARNAGTYGFQNEGYNFGEPWHKKYTGSLSGGSAPAAGKLAEDGKLGPKTIKALQKVLKVAQDGVWGANTTRALQKKLIAVGHKIAADGIRGTATIKALQIYLLGASRADGKMGPETIRGLQHYLNSGGTFPAKSTSTKLTVDGKMGPKTVKALQKVLGVTADGKIGPNTIRALQKKLGTSADGKMGPKTIKALQKKVGATADGKMGPKTIKALQTHLNNGKKF